MRTSARSIKTFYCETLIFKITRGGGAYSDKVLELLVLLLQLFEDIDRLSVVTAELPVHLLHLLSIFI